MPRALPCSPSWNKRNWSNLLKIYTEEFQKDLIKTITCQDAWSYKSKVPKDQGQEGFFEDLKRQESRPYIVVLSSAPWFINRLFSFPFSSRLQRSSGLVPLFCLKHVGIQLISYFRSLLLRRFWKAFLSKVVLIAAEKMIERKNLFCTNKTNFWCFWRVNQKRSSNPVEVCQVKL